MERLLSWNCEKDLFVFELVKSASRADELPVTKRSVLKVVAGMYDPLGIISPIVVSIKVLFQELREKRVGRDEELKEGEWKRWIG